MYNYHNRKKFIYSILLILLLAIGIGYAYLTSNLSISGNTSVTTNTWNIHFENIQVKEGSVTETTVPTLSTNDTVINYAINLSRPKDFYEFTVDVKNDGTLPGKVSISNLSGLDTTSSKIIDYSIKYTNGNPVSIGDLLNAGAKKTIRVRVFYKDEINPSDFPATDLNLTLTYTLQYVQSEVDEFDTNALINQLKTENSSCFTKYTEEVTDQPGETVTASNVYFNQCVDKRNIIFNNMCWQMIRTTETGGIKMIYNGEVVDGKCSSSRGNHKGIVGSDGSLQNLSGSYLYGDSFTYDITNNTFTLIDTTTATWSDSTYENLFGKFTCKTSGDTCTTIYQINGYSSATQGYSSPYTIGDTNYAQIGTSAFNANYKSPAMVGYMFNKVYTALSSGGLTSGALFGNNVSYSNGTYTLLPASGESTFRTIYDDTHHYTCNNTTGTCNKVRYYYNCPTNESYYIELANVNNIETAVNEMLYDDNVNTYNSSIKEIVDSWYVQNLTSKTNMLEDTVFCNARDMSNESSNGWNKDGSLPTYMNFKNNYVQSNMACLNETDQFAVSNNKAKLTYPVGLLQIEEWRNFNYSSLMSSGNAYWSFSPYSFAKNLARVRNVTSGSGTQDYPVGNRYGVRPVVSLNSGIVITGGDGSEASPFVISE